MQAVGSAWEKSTVAQEHIFSEQAHQKIDRYKILEKIGEGGCGVVYVAEQEQPVRRRVALKVIKRAWTPGKWWRVSMPNGRRWQ